MSVKKLTSEQIKTELKRLKETFGFIEPNRGNLDDLEIKWRTEKPNYDRANLEYFKGKVMNHKEGSLEKVVEDLVKTWEMECSHKTDFSQWTTIKHEMYKMSTNGGKPFVGEETLKQGNYNMLLSAVDPDLYDSNKQTYESSHEMFRTTFNEAFPWEVLEVFSGPPKVAFTWRHWGTFNGSYKERKGDGEVYEMYGFCIACVDEELKVESLEVFYKPEAFLQALAGNQLPEKRGSTIVGNGCPFINR